MTRSYCALDHLWVNHLFGVDQTRSSVRDDYGAYYVYPAVTSEPAQLPLPLAQGAGSAALDIRKKGRPGKEKSSPLAGQV